MKPCSSSQALAMFFAGMASLMFVHSSLRLTILGQPRTILELLDGSYVYLLLFVAYSVIWMGEDRS